MSTETTTLEDLLETFEMLDDWQDKYAFIIELGREFDELPEELRTPDSKVKGCMSQVWLVGDVDGSVLRYRAASDAHIVRGLVAILLVLFNGKTPAEVTALDPRPIFAQLGLDKHLSTGRSNGLLSMVGRIKQVASQS